LKSFGPTGSGLSGDGRAGNAEVGLCRVDLHLHTRHSGAGHLRVPRLRRGLPDPVHLYRAARARGMGLVTFTDLDTIDGCLVFLNLHPDAPDFFISEEVRAFEPRTRAAVSVMVFDLTEAQHRDLRALRGDVREIAGYTRGEGLLASLGSVLGVLEAGASEGVARELIGQFECFEIRNGAEDRTCNELMGRLVQEATAGRGFGVTAGSNAHTAARVGRVSTVARAADRAGFLDALRRHRTWAAGQHGDAWGGFAEVFGRTPLHLSAAPLVGHAVTRARRNARARRAKRRLDVIDVERFQEKARSFQNAGRASRPGSDGAR
jgi:PHP domain-containing protein